jgi:hypothetical protein
MNFLSTKHFLIFLDFKLDRKYYLYPGSNLPTATGERVPCHVNCHDGMDTVNILTQEWLTAGEATDGGGSAPRLAGLRLWAQTNH